MPTETELTTAGVLFAILSAFGTFVGVMARVIWVRLFGAEHGLITHAASAHLKLVATLQKNLDAQTVHITRQTEILARIEVNTTRAIEEILGHRRDYHASRDHADHLTDRPDGGIAANHCPENPGGRS
jgi:hypothetical protein